MRNYQNIFLNGLCRATACNASVPAALASTRNDNFRQDNTTQPQSSGEVREGLALSSPKIGALQFVETSGFLQCPVFIIQIIILSIAEP